MIKIDTNIQPPVPLANKPGRPAIYPFQRMCVGESFLVRNTSARKRLNIQNCAFSYGRYHGVKFVTRAEGDGLRVWRVA